MGQDAWLRRGLEYALCLVFGAPTAADLVYHASRMRMVCSKCSSQQTYLAYRAAAYGCSRYSSLKATVKRGGGHELTLKQDRHAKKLSAVHWSYWSRLAFRLPFFF